MSMTHLDGCPKGRSESFGATSPSGEPLTVTRCIDCGAGAVSVGKAVAESEAKAKGKAVAESAAPDAGAER